MSEGGEDDNKEVSAKIVLGHRFARLQNLGPNAGCHAVLRHDNAALSA